MIPLRYLPREVEKEYYGYVSKCFQSAEDVERWNRKAQVFRLTEGETGLKKIGLKQKIKSASINEELKNWLTKNLKDILIGRLDRLRNLREEFQSLLRSLNIPLQEQEELKDIFTGYYEYLRQRRDFSIRLLQVIGVNTCPYCNREYIQLLPCESDIDTAHESGRVTPHFDHFFPKSEYFIFSISLYNLIPCCYFCNLSKQDNFYEDLKSPYEIGHGDFTFSFDIDINEQELGVLAIDLDSIEKGISRIKIKTAHRRNIETFRLEEAYDYHKDVVAEIILKSRIFPNEYYEMLANTAEGLSILSSLSESDRYRILFSAYLDEEDFHRRSLSKLIHDIFTELNNENYQL